MNVRKKKQKNMKESTPCLQYDVVQCAQGLMRVCGVNGLCLQTGFAGTEICADVMMMLFLSCSYFAFSLHNFQYCKTSLSVTAKI